MYVCWNVHQEENISLCTEIDTTAVCNQQGNWEPTADDMCFIFSGKIILKWFQSDIHYFVLTQKCHLNH